ncbi:MAG: hypothetical protein HUU19_15160 [Phycisphaerales bacterium]|nr:hypothetical protein [Phycisphaerales bacterium]
MKPAPGEKYTIRRKVFKIFGASFHIYGPEGNVVGFCKQKAFKLREDLRVYTDESCTTELMRIGTRQVIDLGATYTVSLPPGTHSPEPTPIGSFTRAGLRSEFVRDSWSISDATGREVARLEEDSTAMALLRRFGDLGALIPQSFSVTAHDGRAVATLRTHFNPFVYRLGVAILADHPDMDELLIIALACTIAAIEGRQG